MYPYNDINDFFPYYVCKINYNPLPQFMEANALIISTHQSYQFEKKKKLSKYDRKCTNTIFQIPHKVELLHFLAYILFS